MDSSEIGMMSSKKNLWLCSKNEKMSPDLEAGYQDLLTPAKNIEDSFNVDISALLDNYLRSYVSVEVPASFNKAARMIQASSNLYIKKVEYLHMLTAQLHDTLNRQKAIEQANKDPKQRERHRVNKLSDPFLSTEIKPGKNLSILSAKNTQKLAKKKVSASQSKKISVSKCLFAPPDLIPLEIEEKGEILFDTHGEQIGYTSDYNINKCRINESGWLLMPTVNKSLLPSEGAPADYTLHNTYAAFDNYRLHEEDEGVDTGPPCSSEADLPLSQPSSSQQTDDGIGSSIPNTPSTEETDNAMGTEHSSDNNENIPGDENNQLQTKSSLLKSLQENDIKNTGNEIIAIKRPIEKKNTCVLPDKLLKKENKKTLETLSAFCARTFFAVDDKVLKKKNGLTLDVPAFRSNSRMVKRYEELIKYMKDLKKKSRKDEATVVQPSNEDMDVDMEEIEQMQDADRDSDLDPGFDTPFVDLADSNVQSQERPIVGDIHIGNISAPEFDDLEPDNPIRQFQHYMQPTVYSETVNEWEKTIKPLLSELVKREKFDIYEYGARILNTFQEGSDKRPTMTFKDICKDMPKWKVHRYFMALLPLANMKNVHLETIMVDGEEEIKVTLLSKKMHQEKLEEFGYHNESSS